MNLHPHKDVLTGRVHPSLADLSDEALRANLDAVDAQMIRLHRYHLTAIKDGQSADVDRLLDLKNVWQRELKRRGK